MLFVFSTVSKLEHGSPTNVRHCVQNPVLRVFRTRQSQHGQSSKSHGASLGRDGAHLLSEFVIQLAAVEKDRLHGATPVFCRGRCTKPQVPLSGVNGYAPRWPEDHLLRDQSCPQRAARACPNLDPDFTGEIPLSGQYIPRCNCLPQSAVQSMHPHNVSMPFLA
jgi:hypothetical protein